jgi:hypothetical protein
MQHMYWEELLNQLDCRCRLEHMKSMVTELRPGPIHLLSSRLFLARWSLWSLV